FADGRDAQLQRSREEPHTSFTFERNIVWQQQGALLASTWSSNFVMNANVYWHTNAQPLKFGKYSLEQWRTRGHDADSIVADPLFLAPDKDDYRLKTNSPE